MKKLLFFAELLLLAGCTKALPPVGPDHPANPKAAEAPPPPASTTLAAAPAEEPEPTPPAARPAEQGMEGMHHHGPGSTAPGGTGSTEQPAATPARPAGEAAQYTCPMHPEVVQSQPGSCPKCGMELVEKAEPPAAAAKHYTCPMHPEVESAEPGRCPKCGMDLVETEVKR